MNNKDTARKILKQIQEKKIYPKPKWVYLAKNYLFWLLFAISIIIGALSTGIIIFSILNTDWDIYRTINKNFFHYFLIVLPYFWIFILIIFIFFAYKNYKHTKTGYRVNPFLIISYGIFGSVFLGIIFYLSGFGQLIENKFSENVPHYRSLFERRMLVWDNPEHGLLAGKIIKLNKNSFYIKSLDGNNWKIVDNNTLWKEKNSRKKGNKVKIIGKKIDSNLFLAKEVRPWFGNCKRMRRSLQR